jgi:hypothetical protein
LACGDFVRHRTSRVRLCPSGRKRRNEVRVC